MAVRSHSAGKPELCRDRVAATGDTKVEGSDCLALQCAIDRSLGPALGGAVLAVLQAHRTRFGQLEASIRRGRSGEISGGRMMIERVSLPLGIALAHAFGAVVPACARDAAGVAVEQGLSLIAGWDVRAGEPVAKLYVNASDASQAVRRRIAEQAELPPLRDAPHVIGFNLAAAERQIEIKAYVQSNDAVGLAQAMGGTARWLVRAAQGSHAIAGAVACWDVAEGQARGRAFFVALRDAVEDGGEALLAQLPGWSAQRADACVPFERGPARSIGVAVGTGTGASGTETGAGDEPVVWTAYFKPVAPRRTLWGIEPAACFRAGGVEIGVFLEPIAHAARAFVRTERHALSYRLREGPAAAFQHRPPQALVVLMEWAAARVRAAERAGEVHASCLQAAPPPPWELVRG